MVQLTALAILLAAAAQAKELWLATTPNSPQPYALKKGRGLKQGYGTQGNIYPVTGNSSGKAFCILNTNGAGYPGTGGFPHVHKKTYENFYAFKGRVQLWGQNVDSYLANTSVQTTRILGPGDFGAIPRNTIHTFNLMEPDTTLTGVLVPGGFEEFFFNFGGGFGDTASLAKWDVYPQNDFVPRRDVVNGRAGPGNWYDGANALPPNASNPIWVAKNYGPKYLTNVGGRYQIMNPFVTGVQTDNMFAQGTITMSTQIQKNSVAPSITSVQPTAFMMEEGQLAVTVDGFDIAHLIEGDVVFVPGNTTFSYYAEADYTKFMYVSGGGNGLDAMIMANATASNSAFYPAVDNIPLDRRSVEAWRI